MTGQLLLELAKTKLGQAYILGALTPKDKVDYDGPWDCAKFTSWAVFQASKKLYGCNNNNGNPSRTDTYTRYWVRDAEQIGKIIPFREAIATPGAALLRVAAVGRMGHIAFSDGTRDTIEAHSSKIGCIAKNQIVCAMRNFFLIFLGIMGLAFGQERVNAREPISRIDYIFDSDNNLNVYTILNLDTASGTKMEKIWLTGIINWIDQNRSQSEFKLQLTTNGQKEYRYQTTVIDEHQTKIKLPGSKGYLGWKSIDHLRIILSLGNSVRTYELMPIYSKLNTINESSVPVLQLPDRGSMISPNEVILRGINTRPLTPFEITNIVLRRGDMTYDPKNLLSGNQYKSKDGFLDLTIFPRSITLEEGEWQVSLTGRTDDGYPLTRENLVEFEDKITKIEEGLDSVFLFTSDQDLLSIPVRVYGKGEISVDILTPGYQGQVDVSLSKNGSLYTLKFSNLKTVKDEVECRIISNGKTLTKPFKLIKQKAIVKDFSFDLSQKGNLNVNFYVASWMSKNDLQIEIPERGIKIGAQNLKVDKENNDTYFIKCQLDDYIQSKFTAKDTTLKAHVLIQYKNQNLYDASVMFVNQRLIDAKIDELIKVSTAVKKPKEADIAIVVNEIVEIAKALKTNISKDEQNRIIKELSNSNNSKEKVNKSMEIIVTIGKWLKTFSSFALPLLV